MRLVAPLGVGMSEFPQPELEGKTPHEVQLHFRLGIIPNLRPTLTQVS